ncbi:MAG: hypothetical protein KKH08_07290 [Candidatus Omnitrophica bacterium]|nr:hypothetical protein [Candidatus Omnitrophota bacterium]
MKILGKAISIDELKKIALETFGDLVKAVVDIDKGTIAVDAELHSDLEALLLKNESKQRDLWGINLYPDIKNEDFIEFDSMINIRPSQGNMSRGVDNKETRKKITEIVNNWVRR